jgi:hypothetical protein
MVSAMKEVATVAHEGRSAAQQVTKAAIELSELSARLHDRVAWFELDGKDETRDSGTAVFANTEPGQRYAETG